jgi:hypothetical protein
MEGTAAPKRTAFLAQLIAVGEDRDDIVRLAHLLNVFVADAGHS